MSNDCFQPFSRRHGLSPSDVPVTIWNDAPEDFRHAVLNTARDKCGLRPNVLRDIVCGVLRKRPDPSNWSEYPNVWEEVQAHIHDCEWYRVYDIVEEIRAKLASERTGYSTDMPVKAVIFDEEINSALRELGIGWHLQDGLVQARGDDAFEQIVRQAKETLQANKKINAQNELTEALKDISRRPQPDVTGAIQHSMAALECIAKDVTGKANATLGAWHFHEDGVFGRSGEVFSWAAFCFFR